MAVIRPVPEPTFRELVEGELDEHRKYCRMRVRRWMLFWADLGVRRLFLDECPGLPRTADLKELAAWLEGEGFKVSAPRFGRITVWLGETK